MSLPLFDSPPTKLRQIDRIIALMKDGSWRTLGQIVEAVGCISECGVSARLRECRKLGWKVDRKRIGPNWFSYRIEREA